MIAWHF